MLKYVYRILIVFVVSSLSLLMMSCSCSMQAGVKGNGDLTEPEVFSIYPSKYKTGVPQNTFISATFSEDVAASSVTSDTIYLRDENLQTVSAKLYVKGKSVTLKPNASLNQFTQYKVTIERRVTDLSGNPMLADYEWLFTTGNALDQTPPKIESIVPDDGTNNVSTSSHITVNFNEPIDVFSITDGTFSVSDASNNPVTGTFNVSDNQVEFVPDTALQENTKYTVNLTTGIQDQAGNNLTSPLSSSFTTSAPADTTPPEVVNVFPDNNQKNIATNSNVSVTFSEPISASSAILDNFVVSQNGAVVNGTVTAKDNILIFSPKTDLLANTAYNVTLKKAVSDLSGNLLATDFTWTFTTGSGQDTVPPSISYVQPEADATDVGNNNSVLVVFSETIDPNTLDASQFTVTDANNSIVSGSITYSGTTAIFKPDNDLSSNTKYTVNVLTGIADLVGNKLAKNYSWTFTTGAANDTNIPRVSSIYPENGFDKFPVNSAVITRFTKPMNPISLTPSSFYLEDSNGTHVPCTITTTGASATLRPLVQLNFAETYTANVTTDVSDLANNKLADVFSWSFITDTATDTTSPVIIDTTPSSGSQQAAVNRGIIVTFDEAISAQSISNENFYLQDTGGTILPGTISVTDNTAIYKPLSVLANNTTYTVKVKNTITDMAGNALNKDYTWNFATSPESDTTAPTVLTTIPLENGLSAVNQQLSVRFSEAMNTATLNSSNIQIMDVNGNESPVTVNAAKQTAFIKPVTDLNYDTNYRLVVKSPVKDLADNAMGTDFTLDFKTSLPPDQAPPFVVSSDPFNQESGVKITKNPSLVFSEAIYCPTITTNDFQLLLNNTPVAGAIDCSNSTLKFIPNSALKTQSTYTMTAASTITDLSNTNLQPVFQSSFTTAPWTQQIGSIASDQATSIAKDSQDNLIVGGFTDGDMDGTNQGSDDIVIVKYDKNSNLLWLKQLGSSETEQIMSVATDSQNNIYVTGYTYGDLTGTNLGGSNADIFVIKMDSNGNILWQEPLGTSVDDVGTGIAVDASGYVYISGYTSGSFTGYTNSGLHDIFVIKLDSSGTVVFQTQYGSAGDDIANAITLDGSNNIYLAGYSTGNLQGAANLGGKDIFVSKLTSSGTLSWTKTLGSSAEDAAQSLQLDSAGNVIVAGYTLGALNGQTSMGAADQFVAKYANDGTLSWVKQLGTTLEDKAYNVLLNPDDSMIVSGYTKGDMQGTNTGGFDIVSYKLNSDGTSVWTTQLGSALDDVVYGATLDSAGNIYLAGYTLGSLDSQTHFGASDKSDIFVVKLDVSGQKQ